MKKINTFSRCMLLLCLLLLSNACKEKLSLLSDDNDKYTVLISYEEETLTLIDGLDAKTDPISILSKEPKLNRSTVIIGILPDGTPEIEITNKKPKNPFRIPFEVLPDPNPKTHTMKFSGGYAYSFDKSGALISKMPSEMPSFAEFLKILKRNNNMITRDIYGKYMTDILLKNTGSLGDSLRDDGRYLVSETILGPENGSAEEYTGKKVTTWFDRECGILQGQAISDEANNVTYMIQYKYDDEESQKILPVYTKEQNFETNQEGENYILVTYTEYENENIIVNL